MADILLQERTEEGILVVTLNRPEALNCFNFDLLAALSETIREANFDMTLRCIVITGKMGDDPKKASFSTGADLKERRTLVVVPRETPLTQIHLRRLLELAEAGAVVLPAMPAFYSLPQTLEDVVDHVVGKVLSALGFEQTLFPPWDGGQP